MSNQRIQWIREQGTLYQQKRLDQLVKNHGLTEAEALVIMDAEPQGYRAVNEAWQSIGRENPARVNRDLGRRPL